MSFLDEDTLTAIRQNRFVLDCIRMALRRQSGGPDRYVGGGSVRQTPNGELEFVLYDIHSNDAMKDVFIPNRVGEWLGPEDFWHLSASDLYGNVWIAEWVDADSSSTHAHTGAIVRGTFREISLRSEAQNEGSGFRAYARTAAQIPRNASSAISRVADKRDADGLSRNVWRIESPACGTIVVTQLDDGIDVDLTSSSVILPPHLGVRLEDAFTFVLSAPIEWIVEEILFSGEHCATIRGRSRPAGKPRFRPPIETRRHEGMTHCGILLNQFLAYVFANPPTETRHHPLALSIYKVLRASSLVVEDETLALSTEVERVVREHFMDRGKPQASFLAAIEDALEHLANWTGAVDMKERITNAIRQLKGPNPRTALRKLVSEGLIGDRHVRSWEAIRHVAAHGLPTSVSARELVAQNDVVHQLLLLLVFDIIGYRGRFTDHTVKGYPPIDVPQPESANGAGADKPSSL